MPPKHQLWLWQCLEEYWYSHVAGLLKTHKADLHVVYNGDLVEGAHHGTTQIISGNPEPQAYLCDRVFGLPQKLRPKHTFVVRGTEAHVGPSGASEEAFARSIRAERDPESQKWSYWHLRLKPHGVLIDLQHHPSTRGNLPWTRPQAIQRLAFRIWSEHALRGLDYPRLAVRSHVHVFGDSRDAYPTRAIITPSMQLKTSFAHKVAADSIADVGGIAIVVDPNGQYDVYPKLFEPSLPAAWEASA